MLLKAFPVLLLLLTRDGVLHRLDGDKDQREAATFAQPRAAALLSGGVIAVAHGTELTLVEGKKSRRVPGKFDDVRVLADGGEARLFMLTESGDVLAVDRRSGRRTALATHLSYWLASDGEALFAIRGSSIVQLLPTAHEWPFPGRAKALAAADGKLYLATREGPLYEIDRTSGARRDLGLGGWWGTLALAGGGGKLYAVTEAGKLWEIDPRAGTKTIVAMQGWESALSLCLMR